ncbi:MAG: nitronate monooxygenase [Sphingomonadales bacterium]|nr:MAG: nitronate monooxygenase [Sphingomonadales bacterium]
MSICTRLTESLDIDAPIISAPMAGVSGGALARAVSRAGGFGFIAAGYLPREDVLHQMDLAADARIGVGFITWKVHEDRSAFDAVIDRKPPAIFLSFGDASGLALAAKNAGAILFIQVQSLAMAKQAADLGADIIVVQGSEAGGHGAVRSLAPLLDEVLEAQLRPITIAAGGIGTGRALAAALVRGASGALIGTAFYAAEESLAHPGAKKRAVTLDGDSTERSTLFDAARKIDWPDGWTLRAARNSFSERWRDAATFNAAPKSEQDIFAQAVAKGDFDIAPVFVGEGVGLLNQIEPAGEIVSRIERAAEDTLHRAPQFLR